MNTAHRNILDQHFIGGRMVASHGQERMDIHNPATGELIGRATPGDEVDTERAIAAAKAAFPTWSKTTLDERKAWLQRLADALTERLDDLKEITIGEYGASATFADYIVEQARDFFVLVQDLLQPEIFESKRGQSTLQKLPVGVAGLMTPSNGSPWFVCEKAASALAAGCTVVMKPSELSPFQSKVLMECFEKAGLPAGVINLVNGIGRAHHGEILAATAALVKAGKLFPRVDPRNFSLETVAAAHDAIADRSATGKIVVSIEGASS